MAFGAEPWEWTQQRRERMSQQFPVLADTAADDVIRIDDYRAQRLQMPTAFSQVALGIAANGPENDRVIDPGEGEIAGVNQPGGSITPPGMALPDFGSSAYTNTRARAPQAQPDVLGTALTSGDLGNVSRETATVAAQAPNTFAGLTLKPLFEHPILEGSNPVAEEATRVGNYIVPGSALGNIGGAVAARGAAGLADKLLPEDMNPVARGLLEFGAGLAGGVPGYALGAGAGRALTNLTANRAPTTWLAAAEDALGASRRAEMAAAPTAFEYGRGTLTLTGELRPAAIRPEDLIPRQTAIAPGGQMQAGVAGGAQPPRLTPAEMDDLIARINAGTLSEEEAKNALQRLLSPDYNAVPDGPPTASDITVNLRRAREADARFPFGGQAGGADIPGSEPPGLPYRSADVPGVGAPEPTVTRPVARTEPTLSAAEQRAIAEAEPFPATRAEMDDRTRRALQYGLGDTSVIAPSIENADPVTQMLTRIRDARPLQAERAGNVSALRSRQSGAFAGALEGGPGGEAGMQRALGAMRGAAEQPTFEPLRPYMGQQAIDAVTDQIANHPDLRPFEKAQAYSALSNILDGRVPTPSALAQLESAMPGVTNSLREAKVITNGQSNVIQKVAEVLNLWRTVKTAWDISAPGRQGIMLAAGHPREFFGNFKPMLKALVNDDVAKAYNKSLLDHPNAGLWEQANLYIAPLDGTIGQREEAYMSRLAQRIPGVRASERAYVTYLNGLRTNVFDSMWAKLPESAQTVENAQRVGRWINSSTGRGTIPEAMQDWAAVANGVLFSPRFMVSRFESNGLGAKSLYNLAKQGMTRQALDPVSKQIANDYIKFIGAIGVASGLAAIAGGKVHPSPLSSEFGQVQIGNTRYDLTGGNSTLIRYIAQAANGQRIAGGEDDVTDYPRSKTFKNFMRSKLSPVAALLWDSTIGGGRTPGGVDLTDWSKGNLAEIINEEFGPIILSDMIDAYRHNDMGPAGTALGTPAVTGIGTNTYEPDTASGGGASRPTRPKRPTKPTRPTRGR